MALLGGWTVLRSGADWVRPSARPLAPVPQELTASPSATAATGWRGDDRAKRGPAAEAQHPWSTVAPRSGRGVLLHEATASMGNACAVDLCLTLAKEAAVPPLQRVLVTSALPVTCPTISSNSSSCLRMQPAARSRARAVLLTSSSNVLMPPSFRSWCQFADPPCGATSEQDTTLREELLAQTHRTAPTSNPPTCESCRTRAWWQQHQPKKCERERRAQLFMQITAAQTLT
mmetsp:Transcript_42520/g.98562  ORF Transcript_42520/g.98562 Transcript_42520/m.98562 type:complete len:231 (+) Transcript_42520:427-1119(+)